MFNSLDASDTSIMGQAREAVAAYLINRDNSLRLYELSHLKYTSAMSAGVSYTNAQDLVNESTEQFRDILYNIRTSTPNKIETPEDVKILWEEIMGKPWPKSSSEESDEVGNETSPNEEDS